MTSPLKSLRIPAGWRIETHSLFETESVPEDIRNGYPPHMSLFVATHEARRFIVDVEWKPENDADGRYVLRVYYAPWQRTEEGRRKKHSPVMMRGAECVHTFENRPYCDLIGDLERCLMKYAGEVREHS